MFDLATDFTYITGADIDADHSHGDLDRIRLQGVDLMPDRTPPVDPETGELKDPLYGKDIAFLLEAGNERYSLTPPAASYTPEPFTRKVSKHQMEEIAVMLSNSIEPSSTRLFHWLDPELSVSAQAIQDISGYEHLDTLVGAPRWQVPMQSMAATWASGVFNPLRRYDVLNLFATVSAMKIFVDRRGGDLLVATGYTENDQDASFPFTPTILDGYFYISRVSYQADIEAHGDVPGIVDPPGEPYYSVNGYPKWQGAQWHATGSVLWEMPTPAYLVGRLKEVWALVECYVRETINYRAQGSVSRYSTSGNPVIEQSDEVVRHRLVKCNFASSHTIVAGDKLRIVYADLENTISTLLSDAGKSRWGNVPDPPRGVLMNCGQTIYCTIVAVYPVFSITHTAI